MSADDIYIVGVARTEFGRYDGEDNELAEQAVRGALADCGLAWTDVQFAVGGTNGETKPDNLVSRLGLTGLPFVTVKNGWKGMPEEQGFLRDIQAAACQQFNTVLAPGSNIYHYDHIHVDLMRRPKRPSIC